MTNDLANQAQEQAHDTKQKILETALRMFADQGFEGASIRSISNDAKVNIAAVSYHFGNKENLYFEVVRYSYTEMDRKIQILVADRKSLSFEDVVVGIFDLFESQGSMLVNTFRMLLSGKDTFERLCQSGFDGPPGAMALGAAIAAQVPHLKEDDLFWAVRTLFSLIIHQSLMLCSVPDVPFRLKPSTDQVRVGLRRTTRLILAELRTLAKS